MKAYILVFTRRISDSYHPFHEDLTSNPNVKNWMHYFRSAYVIITDLTGVQLSEIVTSLLEKHNLKKRHLILEVDLKSRVGLLPKEAWEWLSRNASRINQG